MSTTLTVRDETTAGVADHSFTLEFPSEQITVRELIRERVYQEVKDYNRKRAGFFRGLVRPSAAKRTRDGYRIEKGRSVAWKPQFQKAIEAFEKSRILVLVEDRQCEALDEVLSIRPSTEVTFLRLVPLEGG